MEAVEICGRENVCLIATISMINFQCVSDFYEKLGYVRDFEGHGYAIDS